MDSLMGLLFGVIIVGIMLRTKPAFFWEHYKMRRIREQVGDEAVERFGYAFLVFITALFSFLAYLDAGR